jgi:hypothetical protein
VVSSERGFGNVQGLLRHWESLFVLSLFLESINLRVQLFPSRLLRPSRSCREEGNNKNEHDTKAGAVALTLHTLSPNLQPTSVGGN